ncbi:MAG: DUF302 domain-containing protein [Balneolaceae bacterium]
MKQLLFCSLFLFVTASVNAQQGMTSIESRYSSEQTAERLLNLLEENGLTVFERINHHEGAASVEMELPETILIIFGNPALGTPLMQCAPTVAIDLPQKMLIRENEDGDVHISFNTPEYLKERHNIEGCDRELEKIDGSLRNFASEAAGREG